MLFGSKAIANIWGLMEVNRKKSKALNKVTKSHTMLAQDSFLGSLLVFPVELWNGITG